MDKVTLKFLADVLYIKGIIYFEEFNAILNSSNPHDLDVIVDNMLLDNYSKYRGEGYATASIFEVEKLLEEEREEEREEGEDVFG